MESLLQYDAGEAAAAEMPRLGFPFEQAGWVRDRSFPTVEPNLGIRGAAISFFSAFSARTIVFNKRPGSPFPPPDYGVGDIFSRAPKSCSIFSSFPQFRVTLTNALASSANVRLFCGKAGKPQFLFFPREAACPFFQNG